MKELNQFENYLVHEFVEDYEDGIMSRRDMVRRVLHITGGVAATATLLSRMGVAAAQEGTPPPEPAPAGPRSPLSVPADDPRIMAEEITFDGDDATIMAYQARPTEGAGIASPAASSAATPVAGGGLPLVLICHQNRGLRDHIRDVARRWAAEGYVACAVDLLSREGGTANIADPAEIPAILTDADPMQHVADFQAAIAHYETQPFADTSRLGMTGFCLGGGITWRAATQIAELNAAAPYYGPPPPLDDVPNIQAAVLGVYSDDPNDFANEGRDELEEALDAAGITYLINIYPGTQHGFHDDTSARWNEEQALAAWNDTLAWFAQYI
ncbi:MAG: dienelactone hydrolase family protein [Chloroflexota bacterium]|nr:dienelactone hydrolase family protein [Chloroflexota bacterium]